MGHARPGNLDTLKYSQISRSLFETKILDQFSNYFKSLKPCAHKLRDLFFPESGPRKVAMHLAMIAILNMTINELKEDPPLSLRPAGDLILAPACIIPHLDDEVLQTADMASTLLQSQFAREEGVEFEEEATDELVEQLAGDVSDDDGFPKAHSFCKAPVTFA